MLDARRMELWGCDFDPLPDIASVRRKLIRRLNGELPDCGGPYDILEQGRESEAGLRSLVFRGRIPCAPQHSASPDFAVPLLPEDLQKAVDDGLCRQYAAQFANAAAQTEGRFIGVAPDHSLTGGAWRHYAGRFNEMSLIVFDAHLDAFSPAVRNGLAQYALETGLEQDVTVYPDGFTGNYDAGSFLYYLIQEGALKPERLFVLGVEQPPGKSLSRIHDPRVEAYVEQYRRLVKAGAVILSAAQLESTGLRELKERCGGRLAGQPVYVSCDLDAFRGRLGAATRFGGGRGILEQNVRSVLDILGCRENVAAADFMEADVNRFQEVGMSKSMFLHKFSNILSDIFSV